MSLMEDVRAAVDKVYSDKPIVRELCFAQAILESNLDGKVSKLAKECNNLFGIKDTDRRGFKEYTTTECDESGCKQVAQRFEAYPDLESCVQHHRRIMQLPRYVKVWNASSFEDACVEVKKGGYATDPNYPSKLIKRYNSVVGDSE